MQLTNALIRLGATARDKTDAIRQVAALLAENGKVEENTYRGNGVAILAGTAVSTVCLGLFKKRLTA